MKILLEIQNGCVSIELLLFLDDRPQYSGAKDRPPMTGWIFLTHWPICYGSFLFFFPSMCAANFFSFFLLSLSTAFGTVWR